MKIDGKIVAKGKNDRKLPYVYIYDQPADDSQTSSRVTQSDRLSENVAACLALAQERKDLRSKKIIKYTVSTSVIITLLSGKRALRQNI